jgi:CBS domain-containing protein
MSVGSVPVAWVTAIAADPVLKKKSAAADCSRDIEPNAGIPRCLRTIAHCQRHAAPMRHAREATTMTVKSVLTRKGSSVTTIEPTANVAAAVKLLGEQRIGALVVTGAGRRVIGILSERDIVRALAQHGAQALERQVAEMMTRKVVTCTERDTLIELMERMTAGKFRHMPVVEEDSLVGIISIGDVVKSRVEEMERDTEVLQDYIRTA